MGMGGNGNSPVGILWESYGNENWLRNWEWEWEEIRIDWMGMGENGNKKAIPGHH